MDIWGDTQGPGPILAPNGSGKIDIDLRLGLYYTRPREK